jgi:anti-sigma factor RsiW
VTCQEFAGFVIGYLEDELQDEQRRRFDAHLAECSDCERYLRAYRATVRAVAACAEDLADLPDDLLKAILAARAIAPDNTP